VKASPEAQLRLLELAEIDAELTRLEHRRRGLPSTKRSPRWSGATVSCAMSWPRWTPRRGLRREQAKSEGDVEQVRSRSSGTARA